MTPLTIATIIDLVAQANPTRSKSNLSRRILKLVEELGEIAEAFLEFTSADNKKGKSWEDVCEEAADVLIVALDIALTSLDDADVQLTKIDLQSNSSFDAIIHRISHTNALYAGLYTSDVNAAQQCSVEIVRCAFDLNCLLWQTSDQDLSIITEVTRKLDKWLQRP